MSNWSIVAEMSHWWQSDGRHLFIRKYGSRQNNVFLNEKKPRGLGSGNWGPFLTSPLGANFDPRGKVVPQGWISSPGGKFTPWGWNSLFAPPLPILNSRECSPLGWANGNGWTFPLEDKFYPWGWSSPLGARDEVKNVPLFFLTHHCSAGPQWPPIRFIRQFWSRRTDVVCKHYLRLDDHRKGWPENRVTRWVREKNCPKM
jgi:hypothetical protein